MWEECWLLKVGRSSSGEIHRWSEKHETDVEQGHANRFGDVAPVLLALFGHYGDFQCLQSSDTQVVDPTTRSLHPGSGLRMGVPLLDMHAEIGGRLAPIGSEL